MELAEFNIEFKFLVYIGLKYVVSEKGLLNDYCVSWCNQQLDTFQISSDRRPYEPLIAFK